MNKLEDFRKLVRDYHHVADFVIVYMEEAHSIDGWHIRNNAYTIRSHLNLEDRLTAAKRLHQMSLPCPLLVDTMQNEAGASFRAWPERLAILNEGKVVYEGKRGPIGYSLEDIQKYLKKVT